MTCDRISHNILFMKVNPTIKKVTSGICASLLDFTIWYIALVGASIGKHSSRGVYKAFAEADDILNKVNHHTLSTLWYGLKSRKFIIMQKRKNLYNVTVTGILKKRLEQLIPVYQTNRPWDGKLYLITYDVTEKARIKRDKLRNYLRRLKCQKMQESVWITPYNIRAVIEEFVKEYNIPGFIIISDIGKDGGIGNSKVGDLMRELYKLDELNDKYLQFMSQVKHKHHSPRELIFKYLAILKEDPQIPFELLPKDFTGNEAHQYHQKLEAEYIQSLMRPRRE